MQQAADPSRSLPGSDGSAAVGAGRPRPRETTGRRAAAPPAGTTDRRPSGACRSQKVQALGRRRWARPLRRTAHGGLDKGVGRADEPTPGDRRRLLQRLPPLTERQLPSIGAQAGGACDVFRGIRARSLRCYRRSPTHPAAWSGTRHGGRAVSRDATALHRNRSRGHPTRLRQPPLDSGPRAGGGSPRPCGAGHGCQAGAPHPRIPATSSTKPLVGRLDLLLYGSIPHAEQGRRGRTTGAVHAHGDPGCRGVRTTGAPGPPILQSSVRRVHDARRRGPPGHVRETPDVSRHAVDSPTGRFHGVRTRTGSAQSTNPADPSLIGRPPPLR